MLRSPSIRLLGLAAVLAAAPMAVQAQTTARAQASAQAAQTQTSAEAAVEAASAAFEARMQTFGVRAEAIQRDKSLTDSQREMRVASLWSEYQPEVAIFTAAISQNVGDIVKAALDKVDVDAIVDQALNSPEVKSAVAGAEGMGRNGAWAQNDPEQLVTYGLMAQYGIDKANDAAQEAANGAAVDVQRARRASGQRAGARN